ncbi:MAG: hypothetical protein WCA20_17720 [Candidatus Sulfotelmatobacter sp.]
MAPLEVQNLAENQGLGPATDLNLTEGIQERNRILALEAHAQIELRLWKSC